VLNDYGIQLATAPTIEPLTLGELRAHSRVLSELDDGGLAAYLSAARQYIEQITARVCCVSTWRLTFREWPCDGCLVFPRAPVRSIESVQYIDSAGATQTIAPANYALEQYFDAQRLAPAYGYQWPTARDQAAAISVDFVAGYAPTQPLPDPLRQAICMLAAHFVENRETVNIGNISSELPFSVDALITPYRINWL
jgi:uncharacterized phiE125 gp8 family phage protein